MICILYVNVVGFCLGLVALLLERAMPAAAPRRWIWFVIIPISMAIPGFYRVHHSWSIADAFEQQAAQPAAGNALGTASLTVLDPELFPDQTVWSSYGAGYGWLPLVLPFAGIAWLIHTGRVRSRS